MVAKEQIRWEHLEAYKDKRFDEIPAHLLDEVKARVEGQAKPSKEKKSVIMEDLIK